MSRSRRPLSPFLLAALAALPAMGAHADEAAPVTAPPRTAAPAATSTGALPSGRSLLDRAIESSGAKTIADKPSRMTGRFSMAAQGLSGTMTISQAPPDKLLAEIEVPGIGTMRQGYDGKVGWSSDPMQGPRVMTEKEIAVLKIDRGLAGGADPSEMFSSIETVGRTTFDGRDAWEVRMVLKGASEPITAFFDPETGRQVGMRLKQPSPMGELEVTSVMSEFKKFEGVEMPTRITQTVMGMEQVMTIDALVIGAQMPSFAPPPDVQALIDAKN